MVLAVTMGATWALLTGEYPPQPGGVSDYTKRVACGLAEAGDQVHVFAPAGLGSDLIDNGVCVHRLPGHFGPRACRALNAALKELPHSARLLVQYVPHAYGWKAMNLPFCLWLALHRRDPIWVMFHEVAFPWGGFCSFKQNLLAAVNRLMACLVARSAERVFVSIPGWEPLLRPYLPASRKIEWCPIPSNTPETANEGETGKIRARYCATPQHQMLGHFGTYGTEISRGLASTLPALLQSRATRVACLLGRGGKEFAATLSASHPELADRIHAPGALEAEAVANHLAACDLLIFPFPDGVSSRRTSLMAGLALGMPILSTDGPLTEPLWRETNAVRLTTLEAPDALVSAVETMLNDAELRAAYGARARQLYRERFSLEHTIAMLRGEQNVSPRRHGDEEK